MTPVASKSPSPDKVAEVEAQVLAGLSPVPVFAAAINKSTKTVLRMAAAGTLKIVRVGKTPYVRIDSLLTRPR